MGMTKDYAKSILGVFTGNTQVIGGSYNSAGTYIPAVRYLYLGLSSTEPQVGGSGATEPGTDYGYARVLIGEINYVTGQTYPQIISALAKLGTASGGSASNSAQITFNKATSAWPTCKYVCFYDAATGGNLLWYGTMSDVTAAAGQVAILEETNESGDPTLTISLE